LIPIFSTDGSIAENNFSTIIMEMELLLSSTIMK